MLFLKHKYLFLILISLFLPFSLHAAWTEPASAPPGGNVGIPVYSAGGVAQTIDSSLTVGAVGTATTLQGAGSAIGVQGSSPQYAVYGATTAGAPTGFAGVYGTAVDGDDFAGNFAGGGGIAIQGGTMPTIAVGSYVQAAGGEIVSTGGYALGTDVVFNNTNKGLVWQRLDGQWLRGVYVNAGVLTVKGYGAGINFTDQNGNVRMTVSEAGAVAVGGSPVCLQSGSGCPSQTTPDLQAVTNAGATTNKDISTGSIGAGIYVSAGYGGNRARLGELNSRGGMYTEGETWFQSGANKTVFSDPSNNPQMTLTGANLNLNGTLTVGGKVGIDGNGVNPGYSLSASSILVPNLYANAHYSTTGNNPGTADNIWIGDSADTLQVQGRIKIQGGTPGAGKILTSDAVGLASWQNMPSGLGGSGSSNYVAKWTGGSTLGNSSIYDDGSVAIGATDTAGFKLYVNNPGGFGLGVVGGSAFNNGLTVNGGLIVNGSSLTVSTIQGPAAINGGITGNLSLTGNIVGPITVTGGDYNTATIKGASGNNLIGEAGSDVLINSGSNKHTGNVWIDGGNFVVYNTTAELRNDTRLSWSSGQVRIGPLVASGYKLDVNGQINTNNAFCINGSCKTSWWGPTGAETDITFNSATPDGQRVTCPAGMVMVGIVNSSPAKLICRAM